MAFACEETASEPGGPVTFKNVVDGIAAPDFPAVTGRWLAIFSLSSRDALTLGNCRVIVSDDEDTVIAQTQLKDLTFSAESPISRSVVAFQGLAWPHPGRYAVTLVANQNDVLASFPMFVQHVPAPPEGS